MYICFFFYQDLIKTQERIRELVPGFKFNLGFSGKYFHRGTWEENEGDDTILGKQFYRFQIKLHKNC